MALDWDFDPRYRAVSTRAWAHSEEFRLSFSQEILRVSFKEYYPLQIPESLVLEYDWLEKRRVDLLGVEDKSARKLIQVERPQVLSPQPSQLQTSFVSTEDKVWF